LGGNFSIAPYTVLSETFGPDRGSINAILMDRGEYIGEKAMNDFLSSIQLIEFAVMAVQKPAINEKWNT
jgi:hypothetical protein